DPGPHARRRRPHLADRGLVPGGGRPPCPAGNPHPELTVTRGLARLITPVGNQTRSAINQKRHQTREKAARVSGSEPFEAPRASLSPVAQPVVQPAGATLPELE